jgi:hypothetical protein
MHAVITPRMPPALATLLLEDEARNTARRNASTHFAEPLKLAAARRANVTPSETNNEIKAMLLRRVAMLRKSIVSGYRQEQR